MSRPNSPIAHSRGYIAAGSLPNGPRSSPLTGQPRLAITPGNALANYLYALVEAEARIACLAVGLDPGLGIVHADQKGRDSLALDLMEAVRPEVDRYVLRLLGERSFAASDFYETRRGNCRILPPLTRLLAETAPVWASRLAPAAEHVVRLLATTAGVGIDRVPTPLTQQNRSAGRDSLRRRAKSRSLPTPALRLACRLCGVELANGGVYCDACLPAFRSEQQARFAASGPESLARLRNEGRDPAHGGNARERRAATMSKRKGEAAEWERARSQLPDPAMFTREILPRLQGIPLRALVEATGLSLRYCSLIRSGERVPHTRLWDSFAQAAVEKDSLA